MMETQNALEVQNTPQEDFIHAEKDLNILAVAPSAPLPESGFNLKAYLAREETAYIHQALLEHQGIVAKAAKRLGLQRTTLVEKMRKYGIKRQITQS